MQPFRQLLLAAALVGASLLGGFVARLAAPGPAQAAPLAALASSAKVTLLNVPNASTNPDLFGTTAVKITDVGTFVVENPASLVEVTHQGRLLVDDMIASNGVYFELRVDETTGLQAGPGVPSGMALIRFDEIGQNVPSVFSGYWQNLEAGTHTVSLWVRAANSGQGDNALVDPGGWASNIVVVKEYLPFGASFLPAVGR